MSASLCENVTNCNIFFVEYKHTVFFYPCNIVCIWNISKAETSNHDWIMNNYIIENNFFICNIVRNQPKIDTVVSAPLNQTTIGVSNFVAKSASGRL